MSSQAQRRTALETCARKCLDAIDELPGATMADAHNVAFNVLDSIEKAMLQRGLSIPTYSRKLGGQTRADKGNFCLCKRCNCVEKDEEGWYCTAFYVGPKRQRYYVTDDDGCARGIPRKEYR